MSYKNTMKLFASNFTLVWKQLFYIICTVFILTLCSSAVATPIIEVLKNNGVAQDFELIFKTVYSNPSQIALRVSDMFKHGIKAILLSFPTLYWNIIGTIFLCFILPFILFEMSKYNLTSILFQKFTMNMDVNYSQNMLQTLKQSIRYAFANIVFNLPFVAGTLIIFEIYLLIATSIISAIVGLIILSAILIILISIKISLFAYYTSYMVEHNCDPFAAFGKSLLKTFKDFWKILSMSIVLVLTIIFVNGFIAVFTFFSGLFVTIPASFVVISIYSLVTYFGSTGKRYYLSNSLIYNPVQYTIKKDDYVSIQIPEAKEIQVTTTVMKKKYKKTNNSKKKVKDNYERKHTKKSK